MEKEKSIEELVLRYGKMKYSPEQICRLLGLDEDQSLAFLNRLKEPFDPIRIIYDKAVAMGDYKMDRMLEKAGQAGNPLAISELGTRQYHRRQDELKKELFGI